MPVSNDLLLRLSNDRLSVVSLARKVNLLDQNDSDYGDKYTELLSRIMVKIYGPNAYEYIEHETLDSDKMHEIVKAFIESVKPLNE